jgi:predicted component of type VI protein secretion system
MFQPILSHYSIKLLHIIFACSLGGMALWLFFRCVVFDRARRSSPFQRAELFLAIRRESTPFSSLKLRKGHYLIGRDHECDILLKGAGIPRRVGEIERANSGWVFRHTNPGTISINGANVTGPETKLQSGDEIQISDYYITIEERETNVESGRNNTRRPQARP